MPAIGVAASWCWSCACGSPRSRTGHVLQLIARDPGAPADIPAWCRMTGNTLLREEHPVYYIKRGT